jgi:hypothetical protein
VDSPSCGLGEYRLTALAVGVDDRAEAHGDCGTRESSSPSLGPDPFAFWNSVVLCSSYTQMSDARSIAVDCHGLPPSVRDRNHHGSLSSYLAQPSLTATWET